MQKKRPPYYRHQFISRESHTLQRDDRAAETSVLLPTPAMFECNGSKLYWGAWAFMTTVRLGTTFGASRDYHVPLSVERGSSNMLAGAEYAFNRKCSGARGVRHGNRAGTWNAHSRAFLC
eukprot:4761906-Pleurochrysis_carterae.AAC.17